MERKDILDKYKWDLSVMYENDTLWKEEYDKVYSEYKEILNYKGKILESSANLLNTIELELNIGRKLEKLYVYAYMRLDEDTNNTYYQEMVGKIDNLNATISLDTSFITPELLESDYSKVEEFIKENDKLKRYEKYLKEIYRYKEHTLSKEEERVIAAFQQVLSNPSKTSSLLRNSDLDFGTINVEGEEVKLNNSNYSLYISSNNRQVRMDAFKTLYKEYAKHKNTLAQTLSGDMASNITISKLRGYNSVRESSLFDDNISLDIYDNLVDTVNNNMSTMYKYLSLRKKVLNLDELHLYDIYAPLIEEDEKKYTYEEAREIILKALSVFGEDYIANINKAFDENWIDVYPNDNKRSGAYSWGCYDSNPFILTNFQGRYDDVSTLAHELGHSMHSYYSNKNNDYEYSRYSIFVAEVASTVNELLLAYHMLETTEDVSQKLKIINELLELYKGTIYRQTMFAEFEKEIYDLKEKDEVITYEVLNNIYYDLNKKYFGKDVVIDDEIKYEWSRIPHFYTSFYVYQYATGLSAATHIVNSILNNEENAIKNYLEFLKTGGIDYPTNELKIAGVNIENKEVIESAIKTFDSLIDKFEKIYTK